MIYQKHITLNIIIFQKILVALILTNKEFCTLRIQNYDYFFGSYHAQKYKRVRDISLNMAGTLKNPNGIITIVNSYTKKICSLFFSINILKINDKKSEIK